MPHRAFTAAQLRAMKTEEEVVFEDELLPSLRDVCTERNIEWKNVDPDILRQNLRPVQNLQFECARLRSLREELECPICRQTPRAKEVIFVCDSHHHVCFTCLLSILRTADQGHAEPLCPMRCGALHIHDAPGPVFRNMLAALDAPHSAPYSEVYQVYTGLHRCGYYSEPWHSTPNLSHFSKHIVEDPLMWSRAQQCVHTHRHHLAYLNALPPGPASSEYRCDSPLIPALDAPLSPAPPPHPPPPQFNNNLPFQFPPAQWDYEEEPDSPPLPMPPPGAYHDGHPQPPS